MAKCARAVPTVIAKQVTVLVAVARKNAAKMANVPILLGYLDYKNKIAGIGKVIIPSDDMEKDMREIIAFYKDSFGCHPKKFIV